MEYSTKPTSLSPINRADIFKCQRRRSFTKLLEVSKTRASQTMTQLPGTSESRRLLGSWKKSRTALDQAFALFKELSNISRNIDDDYLLKECFVRLRITETVNCTLVLTAIGSGILANEFEYIQEGRKNEMYVYASLIIVSICSILSIIPTTLKYFIRVKLKVERGLALRNCIPLRKVLPLSFEILLALLHPNVLARGYTFKTDEAGYLKEVTYELNDYLLIILICRIYTLMYCFIVSSRFYSPKSERIARNVGLKPSLAWAIKCIFEMHPFWFLLGTVLIVVPSLAVVMRSIEGPAYTKSGNYNLNDFRPLSNCLWQILITMTTVGYGDYIPKTALGRIIAIIACISGSIIIALILVAMQKAFILTPSEDNALNFKEKVNLEEKIMHATTQYYLDNYILNTAMNAHGTKRQGSTVKNLLKAPQKTAKEYHELIRKQLRSKLELKHHISDYRNIFNMVTDHDMINNQIESLLGYKAEAEIFHERLCKDMEEIKTYVEQVMKLMKKLRE